MAQNSLGKKGQYFSFDAIIATVIVVIAMTSLLTYWFSVQSVVDAKSNYMQSAAMNMADTLMSPGIPENWYDHIDTLQQIGFTNNFTDDINETKVKELQNLINNVNSPPSNYKQIKNLFHLGGQGEEFYVLVEQTNDLNPAVYAMGCVYPNDAAEVAIAHRGGTLISEDSTTQPVPVRVLVAVWLQNESHLQTCPPNPSAPT